MNTGRTFKLFFLRLVHRVDAETNHMNILCRTLQTWPTRNVFSSRFRSLIPTTMSASEQKTDDRANDDFSKPYPVQMQPTSAVQANSARKRLFTDTDPEYANSSSSARKRHCASGSALRNEETSMPHSTHEIFLDHLPLAPAQCDPVPTEPCRGALLGRTTSPSNNAIQHFLPQNIHLGSSSVKSTIPTPAGPLSPCSVRQGAPPKPPLTLIKPFIIPADPQPPISLPKFPSLVAKLKVPDNLEAYEEVLKEKDQHAAELQHRLDAALHEIKRMRSFMEDMGMRLIKGPHRA